MKPVCIDKKKGKVRQAYEIYLVLQSVYWNRKWKNKARKNKIFSFFFSLHQSS